MAILLLVAAAAMFVTSGLPSARAQEQNVYFILDASGSMWAQMEGTTKIEIAKSKLLDGISLVKDKLRVGIVVYGHRRRGDCEDIEEIVKLQPVDEVLIAKTLEGIKPKGKTPIARSVEFITEKLRALEEAAHVILISDGEESCHANPCEKIKQLHELGINFTLDVVGFDVTPEQREQLQCIADISGQYFTAASATELYKAIAKAEKALPVPIAPQKGIEVPKVAQNVQIILDRSEEMAKDFSGRRKIDVAREGIAEKITEAGAEAENLALRLVGGSRTCNDTADTRLEVPFAVDNGAKIKSRLDALEMRGDPTLAEGLLASATDFDDPNRFTDVSNRIVVFTGSRDYCPDSKMLAVRKAFEAKRIRLDVYFIAMKLPPNEKNRLQYYANLLEGHFFPADNQKEFDRVLEQIFEVEPVLAGIRTISNTLNSVISHLNTAVNSVEREDYARAKEEAQSGRGVIKSTDITFRDLGDRQSRKTFRELYETASENRQLQSQLFELIDGLIVARQENNDIIEYNNIMATHNQKIERYNRNIQRLEELTQPLTAR